jgi:hypothetical protein
MLLLRTTYGLLAALLSIGAFANDEPIPLLERIVSINLENDRLDVALKKIAAQAGFTFSYNSSIIDDERVVNQTFKNKTVREILDEIFSGTIQYKARGKYVILTKAAEAQNKKDQRTLSGYIIDESTGRRLQNVSVYDPVSLSSTVTDSYGYFQIKVDQPSGEEIKLAVSKLHYTDTIVAVTTDRRALLKIQLHEKADRMNVLADSVRQKIKRFWDTKILTPQAANMENIQDTLYRKFQFSIVPFVGTNHKLSGNVINDYSYNWYGGYSLGVEKLEIGGVFNMVRGDVNGAQFAGLFNSVGGKMKFLQIAGGLNMNRDSVTGYQLAGLINLNGNSSTKPAAAGLLNLTYRDSKGTHVAGLGNGTIGSQQGPHLAGLFNFSIRDTRPLQAAGIFNFTTGKLTGAQVGGVFNFAQKETTGAQVAGLINISTKRITGAQVSGLLNYATKVRGSQVGLINVTDSIRGVPVGLLSFVLKGYHKLEVSADEIFYTNLAFRTGVRQFYNILTVGAKPHTFEEEETEWTFGYGIGTAPRLSRRLSLNVDVTAQQVVYGNTIEAVNMINKVYLGLEFQALKYVGVTLGITLNGYVTDITYDKYRPLFTDYQPHIISDRTYSNDMNLKMWWGGKIGVRFL